MSCMYYLRDRKITNQIIKELDLLEKEFNSKLNNLYEELNNKIPSILPINNKDEITECREYEPNYTNETTFYIDLINKYDIGNEYDKYCNDVDHTKRLEDIKSRYGENSVTYKNEEILVSKLNSEN